MQNKVKLTRRQIKEDKFATFMLASKDRIMDNWQFYVIGAIVVVLLVVAVTYFIQTRGSSTIEAGTKLANALMDYRQGNNQVAILGLNQVVEDYSSDPAAEQATFLLGKVNFAQRNYPEAIRYYDMYLAKYKDNQLYRAAALAGIAACQENQGNYSEAAAKYLAAFEAYSDGPLAGDYNLSAMRCYLNIGDDAKAKARLDDISTRYKGTEIVSRALELYAEKGHGQTGS
ncbi:MAG: tetratricopeptide repeat protein [Candidatus Zixiibacteriota bacterium]